MLRATRAVLATRAQDFRIRVQVPLYPRSLRRQSSENTMALVPKREREREAELEKVIPRQLNVLDGDTGVGRGRRM